MKGSQIQICMSLKEVELSPCLLPRVMHAHFVELLTMFLEYVAKANKMRTVAACSGECCMLN